MIKIKRDKRARHSWHTSDLHFNHDNIIHYCQRPFKNVDEMNKTIIANWNALVQKDDLVYIHGDLGLDNPTKIGPMFQQLNGIKILIRGNHDKNVEIYKRYGLLCWMQEAYIQIANEPVLISHYPYRCSKWWYFWSKLRYGTKEKYHDRRPKNKGGWLIHGHTHSHIPVVGREINVALEAWDYRPVHISEIERIISNEKVNKNGIHKTTTRERITRFFRRVRGFFFRPSIH